MKKLKKLLIGALSFVLGAALTLVGTLAYLQDETDTAFNVMTSGNVKIEQLELERNGDKLVEFNIGKPADPAVYNDANVSKDVSIDWASLGYDGASDLYADSIGNVVDHFVFVKNTGKNAAYIRTVIAIECPNGFNADNIHINKTESDAIVWTDFTTTIEGVQYLLLVATYKDAVAGGTTAAPSLLQLYLDPTVVNEDVEKFGDTWDVLVISQAVQTTGFEAPDGVLPADYALDKAFGDVNSINTPWDNKEITIPAVANDAAELRALLDVSSEIVVYGDMNAVGTVDVPSWTNAPAEFIFDATVVNEISGGNFVLDEASKYGIVARISADEYLSLSDMQITANSQWPVYLSNYGGNLVVSDVTIDAEAGAGIYPYGTNGTTVLNNVKVNQNRLDPAYSSSTPWAATAVATSNGHNLVINSGTYIGSQWAVYGYNSGSTITINGGTFKAPTVIQLDGVWSGTNKSVATVNGGNFDGAIHLDWGTNAPELYIKGGTFTNFSATVYGAAKLVITGGTFDADPSAYVADDYVVGTNLNGTYTVYPENDTWDGSYDTSWYDEVQLTAANPANTKTAYYLYTAEQFAGFAKLVNTDTTRNLFDNVTVYLAVNVDLGGADWTPIGSTFNSYEFSGHFDGMNHTVSNFNVVSKAGAALFGFVRNSGASGESLASVNNLTVKDVTAAGGDYVAGVVGQLYGTADNCHAINVTAIATPFLMDNGIYDGGAKAGGVIGWIESGAIYSACNCTATNVTVKAYRDLGGVIGMAHNNNTVTNNKAYGVSLSYVYLADGAAYNDNTKNGNIGAVIGRRGSGVVESGTYAEDVTIVVSTAETFRNALVTSASGTTIKLADNISLDADDTITIAAGDTKVIDLDGFTLGGISDVSTGNRIMIDVRGTLTVKNGNVVFQHVGTDMAWGAMVEPFYVGFNGTLNVEKATIDNLGGSAMAYCIDLVNATNVTLNVNDSTLKSTYIPVRVFNNSATGVNNVTIKGSTLSGKYAFWTQYYLDDGRTADQLDATLKYDIFNGNTFESTAKPSAPVIAGFDVTYYFTANGESVVTNASDFKDSINDGGTIAIDGKLSVEDITYFGDKAATITGGTFSRDTASGNPLLVNTTEKVTFNGTIFESAKGSAVLATRKDGANIELNNCVFNNLAAPSTGNTGIQVFASNVTIVFNNCTFNNMPIDTNSSYPDNITLVFNECTFTWTGDNCPGMIKLANYVEADIDLNDCKFVYTTNSQYDTAKNFIDVYMSTGTTTIDFNNFEVVGNRNNDKIWKVCETGKNVTITATGDLSYTFNGTEVDFNTYLK